MIHTVALLLLAAAATAVDLEVRDEPPPGAPASLAIRAVAAAGADDAPPAPSPAPAPVPAAEIPTVAPDGDRRFLLFPTDLSVLSERVVFRFQLGQGVEEGQPSGQPRLSGAPLTGDEVAEGNRNTRFYTIGDVVVGSHGLLFQPLHSYLAARFRLDQQGDLAGSASAPSIFDAAPAASGVLVRSAYGEISGLGGALAPLRLRAGRQFRYGLAVVHFDGLSGWWDGRSVAVSFFSGRRASPFQQELLPSGLSANLPAAATGLIAGASLELRLARFTRAQVVLTGDTLSWEGEVTNQGGLRWEPSRDAALSAFVRARSGHLTRWGTRLEARLSRVTTVSFDLERRTEHDWVYDMVIRDPAGPNASFLRFGVPAAELRAGGRAGTVLLDNLDLFFEAALAAPTGDVESPLQPRTIELGGGVDGRFAYNLNIGVQARLRRYFRPRLSDDPTRFGDLAAAGELWRADGGVRARHALGRKNFSTELELTGGLIRTERLEGEPLALSPETDGIVGMRFRFEAWIGPRFRILAEYELASVLPTATELVGMQRLALIGEASF